MYHVDNTHCSPFQCYSVIGSPRAKACHLNVLMVCEREGEKGVWEDGERKKGDRGERGCGEGRRGEERGRQIKRGTMERGTIVRGQRMGDGSRGL